MKTPQPPFNVPRNVLLWLFKSAESRLEWMISAIKIAQRVDPGCWNEADSQKRKEQEKKESEGH